MDDLKANCRVWIYSRNRAGVFGDGKARLLHAIDEHGSLQEAAKVLGISYRKAWGDLKKAETCLKLALVDRVRGGKSGGQMQLTDNGRRWLEAFVRCRGNIDKCVEKETRSLLKRMYS